MFALSAWCEVFGDQHDEGSWNLWNLIRASPVTALPTLPLFMFARRIMPSWTRRPRIVSGGGQARSVDALVLHPCAACPERLSLCASTRDSHVVPRASSLARCPWRVTVGHRAGRLLLSAPFVAFCCTYLCFGHRRRSASSITSISRRRSKQSPKRCVQRAAPCTARCHQSRDSHVASISNACRDGRLRQRWRVIVGLPRLQKLNYDMPEDETLEFYMDQWLACAGCR